MENTKEINEKNCAGCPCFVEDDCMIDGTQYTEVCSGCLRQKEKEKEKRK